MEPSALRISFSRLLAVPPGHLPSNPRNHGVHHTTAKVAPPPPTQQRLEQRRARSSPPEPKVSPSPASHPPTFSPPAGAGPGMTATSRAPRRPRIRPRGPPPAPTPIRTARGLRSAAADERVLAEFLEASLRVPDLSLPPPRKRFNFPPAPTPEPEDALISLSSRALVSGDADAAVTAAAESGAFRVTGAVDAREVRDAVEAASEVVFAAPEEVKRDHLLGRWLFRRRDGAPGEEFFWFRPVIADEDRAMDAAFPASTYRAFREKMDNLASKMEDVAKAVISVLSDNVKNAKASAQFREAPSILCLTLYSSDMSRTCWNEFDSTTPNSHALSIHLCGHDRRICARNLGGSTLSSLPAGSMLVTIGKQIQEWSNGQFKTSVAEVLFEVTDQPGPFISVELIYCPDDLHVSEVGRHASFIDRPKIVSFRDQILIALILLSFFYLFRC